MLKQTFITHLVHYWQRESVHERTTGGPHSESHPIWESAKTAGRQPVEPGKFRVKGPQTETDTDNAFPAADQATSVTIQ